MKIKKAMLSLVLTACFVAPTSIYAETSNDESDVTNAINTYYTAEQNSDLSTMLETSTDTLFPDK
ncbi:hypothetical protein [Paenibacillus chibensis]|uniref:hypothetical protein n=1 Tax=Paenibacillus chibensis TaxID=59846 RepID=UPI000FD6DF6F|nr:hypothetical protein [Paenibacillus chibensis]MEC0373142.1 hypothetical protein [Paenibacillus chibensis]